MDKTRDSEELEDRMKAPFPPDRVHFRTGGGGNMLAYIDARDVMERLDAVVGPEGWEDSFVETPSGRIICRLTVLGVSKSDGAGDTGFEAEKGAISDAFKRAAVKHGIGRYLYDLPTFKSAQEGRAFLSKSASTFSSKQMKTKYWRGLRDGASESDSGKVRELWDEMNSDQQLEIWRDFSSGIRSTIKELLDSTKEKADAV